MKGNEMVYPKWIYRKDGEAKVVNSKEEHKAAGKGWAETPTAFEKVEEPEAEEAPKDETPAAPEKTEQ